MVPVPIKAGPATSPIAVKSNPMLAKAKAPKMKEKVPSNRLLNDPVPTTKARTTYNKAMPMETPNKPNRGFDRKRGDKFRLVS